MFILSVSADCACEAENELVINKSNIDIVCNLFFVLLLIMADNIWFFC